MNGSANNLVNLKTILSSPSEMEHEGEGIAQENNSKLPNNSQRIDQPTTKTNVDDFDLNSCGASWGSTAGTKNKKSPQQNERKVMTYS